MWGWYLLAALKAHIRVAQIIRYDDHHIRFVSSLGSTGK
jgi:hypothetical protein